MPAGRQNPSQSTTFISCTFTHLRSTSNGGAISFSNKANGILTVSFCIFTECSCTVPCAEFYGGGAVFSNCGKFFSSSSSYISCVSPSHGGGILTQTSCVATIASSAFISCSASFAGGGMISYNGSSVSVSDSRFMCCHCTLYGGGLYHNCLQSQPITLRNSLFTQNEAFYLNTVS